MKLDQGLINGEGRRGWKEAEKVGWARWGGSSVVLGSTPRWLRRTGVLWIDNLWDPEHKLHLSLPRRKWSRNVINNTGFEVIQSGAQMPSLPLTVQFSTCYSLLASISSSVKQTIIIAVLTKHWPCVRHFAKYLPWTHLFTCHDSFMEIVTLVFPFYGEETEMWGGKNNEAGQMGFKCSLPVSGAHLLTCLTL